MRSNYNRASIAPDDSHALTGGHWQSNRYGIRRWVAHECPDCGEHLPPGQRCDTCLTWAVKNARDFEWARIRWANRNVIWDVLDLQKETEVAAA